MRHGLATACLTFSLMSSLMAVQSAIADPSVKDLASRTEVRPIETLTLSDQQFLTGDESAAKAAVIGVAPAAGRRGTATRRRAHAWFRRRRRARGVLVEELQRDGHRIICGGQLLRTRSHQRIGEPGAAGTLQHDP